MPADNLFSYPAAAQLACSNASLANGSSRESAILDNTTAKVLDTLIALTFTISSGSPSTTGAFVNVYVAPSNDGTLFPILQLSSGAPYATGGGDSSVGALGVPPGLRLIGSYAIQSTTSAGERTFRTPSFSVAGALGGNMPPKCSIIVENLTGIAFSASTTTSANYLQAQGIKTVSGT